MIIFSQAWKQTYPGASVGILAMRNVDNSSINHPRLDQLKTELETELRARYLSEDRRGLRQRYPLDIYHNYYKSFKKTYHIQLQLESIVFKDQPIPRSTPLVEAMFTAELKNLLLTSGHDLDAIQPMVRVDVAKGDENYQRINRADQTLKPGDMYIADAQGILSSIIYGPDFRTRITPQTTAAYFTTYAPAGISSNDVLQHLKDTEIYIQSFAPAAETLTLAVFPT